MLFRATSRPPRPGRGGISLLEVLFSVFVLTTGLLGFSLLLPIGRFHAAQSNHMDRAVSVGEAAFREIEARHILSPSNWVYYANGSASSYIGGYAQNPPIVPNQPVFLDPLLVAYQAGAQGSNLFPYAAGVNNGLRIPRVTHANFVGVNNVAQAERACVWRDDLVAEVPESDEGGRPVLLPINGSTVSNFTGDYSWAAMVTPIASENEQAGTQNIYQPSNSGNQQPRFASFLPYSQRRLFKVSVIVFYKRSVRDIQAINNSQITVPRPERQVQVKQVIGNGLLLSTQNQQVGTIKANQWILLSARARRNRAPFYGWYRVVNVGSVRNSVDNVYVTLAGPDFPLALTNGTPVATIVDGVVGVFERIIRADNPAQSIY